MMRSALVGDVDMIFTSLSLTLERHQAVNYLVPVAKETLAMMIRNPLEGETLAWSTYRYIYKVLGSTIYNWLKLSQRYIFKILVVPSTMDQ